MIARPDLISYTPLDSAHPHHAFMPLYIRPDTIDRIDERDGKAVLVLHDGKAFLTNDSPGIIAERCKVATLAARGTGGPAAEIPRDLTLESLTIRAPGGCGSIKLMASKSATGIWVESADRRRFASLQAYPNGGVSMEMGQNESTRLKGSNFAVGLDNQNKVTMQAARGDRLVFLDPASLAPSEDAGV